MRRERQGLISEEFYFRGAGQIQTQQTALERGGPAALAALLPRTATSLAWIGISDRALEAHFAEANPACLQNVFADLTAFFSTPLTTTDSAKALYDAVYMDATVMEDAPDMAGIAPLAEYLSPDGVVLAGLDNPFYYQRQAQWDPEAAGRVGREVADFLAKMQASFAGSGFMVDHHFLLPAAGMEFAGWWESAVAPHADTASSAWHRIKEVLRAETVVFRLTRRPARPLLLQGCILRPVGGVNAVRMDEPLTALATLPGISCELGRTIRLRQDIPEGGKILVWHRPILTKARSLAQIVALRKAGYLIITEFDDHYSVWPEIEANRFLTFAGVHGVQTTTPELAALFARYNPETAVFPNQLNLLPVRALERPSQRATIFFGALNRHSDWAPLMPAINRAMGQITRPFHWDVMMDQRFFDALETEHKTFTPLCDYRRYRDHLSRADIAFMPLEPTLFNGMKSDLKMVEAAGLGAVPVAGRTVYGRTDPDQDFSVLCDDAAAFADALCMLINQPEERIRRQRAGRDYVRVNRLLYQHLPGRIDWYRDLLSRKSALDVALDQRLRALD